MFIIHLLLLLIYTNSSQERLILNLNLDNFNEVTSCTKLLSSKEYLDLKEITFKELKDNFNVVEVKVIEEDCERSTI